MKCPICKNEIEDHTQHKACRCATALTNNHKYNNMATSISILPRKTHVDQMIYRIKVCELLKICKDANQLTYKQLSDAIGLPITVLNRYARGHVLPNIGRCDYILQVLLPKTETLK